MINTQQHLILLQIRSASFNNFDGGKVAHDLMQRSRLWDAVEMPGVYLLRDIPKDDAFHGDTLYILTDQARAGDLYAMALTWKADEVFWLNQNEAERRMGKFNCGEFWILRVWWD